MTFVVDRGFRWPLSVIAAGSLGVLACGDDGSSGTGGMGGGGSAGGDTIDAQRPSQGEKGADAWLQAEPYADWACEPAARPARAPSPHGSARVCSNEKMANAGASGEFPEGAAAVKELFDGEGTLIGHAISLKIAAASDGGKGWYWYEKMNGSVVADGVGEFCQDCHSGASSEHAPNARDYVFTQVEE